jgi:hypothetical protein
VSKFLSNKLLKTKGGFKLWTTYKTKKEMYSQL